MEQSPLWQANNRSVSQEIIHLSWNYRVHKSPSLVIILSQMNPVHIFHLQAVLSKFSHQSFLPIHHGSYPCYMPVHPIIHDLITLIIFGEALKLLSSSLRSLLQSPVTSSLLCLNILLSTAFSKRHLPLTWETKFHTHTKQQVKVQLRIFLSLIFETGDGKINESEPNGNKHSPNLICS